jgi:hypothetical protein
MLASIHHQSGIHHPFTDFLSKGLRHGPRGAKDLPF